MADEHAVGRRSAHDAEELAAAGDQLGGLDQQGKARRLAPFVVALAALGHGAGGCAVRQCCHVLSPSPFAATGGATPSHPRVLGTERLIKANLLRDEWSGRSDVIADRRERA